MVCKTELNSLHVLYFLIDLVPGILFTSLQPDFHICVVFYVVFDLEKNFTIYVYVNYVHKWDLPFMHCEFVIVSLASQEAITMHKWVQNLV